jgi:phosphoribosylformylglycinamidine synthase PurS subunit
MKLLARIHVTLKPGVNDPQGLAVAGGLHRLGFTGVQQVRVGRYLEVTLEAPDQASAEQSVEQMCRQLLANPVIETYTSEVVALPASAPSSSRPVQEGAKG